MTRKWLDLIRLYNDSRDLEACLSLVKSFNPSRANEKAKKALSAQLTRLYALRAHHRGKVHKEKWKVGDQQKMLEKHGLFAMYELKRSTFACPV